jgi:hypothetical protein
MTAPLRFAAFAGAKPAFGLPTDPRGRHRPRADRPTGLTLATIGTGPRDLGDTVRRLREREPKLTPTADWRDYEGYRRVSRACFVMTWTLIFLIAGKTEGWF